MTAATGKQCAADEAERQAQDNQGYHWSLDMRASTPVLVAGGVLIATLVAQLGGFGWYAG